MSEGTSCPRCGAVSAVGGVKPQAGAAVGEAKPQAGSAVGGARPQAGPAVGGVRPQAGPTVGGARLQAGPAVGGARVETAQEKYYREMLEEQRKQAQLLQMQNEQLRQMQVSNNSMRREIQTLQMPKKRRINWVSFVAIFFFAAGILLPFARVESTTISVPVLKYREDFLYSGEYTDFVDQTLNGYTDNIFNWCVKLTGMSIEDGSFADRFKAWNNGRSLSTDELTMLRFSLLAIGMSCGILIIVLIVDMFKKIRILKFFFCAVFTALYLITYIAGCKNNLHSIDATVSPSFGLFSLIAGSAFVLISLFTYGKEND